MLKKSLFNLALVAALGTNAVTAQASEPKGRTLFNTNNPALQAEKPWNPLLSGVVTGVIAGAIAGGCVSVSPQSTSKEIVTVGGVVGAITGLIMGLWQWRYENAYESANGLNVFGTAAANNAVGTEAWINYYGRQITLDKDGTGKTPLMYAAGNGACNAGEVVLAQMPQTKKVVDSTTKSEAVTHAVTWPIANNDKWPEKTTTTATTYKEVQTIDEQDNKGCTAILHAAYGEHVRMMQLLFEFGADASKKDKLGLDLQALAKTNAAVQKFYEQAQHSR